MWARQTHRLCSQEDHEKMEKVLLKLNSLKPVETIADVRFTTPTGTKKI